MEYIITFISSGDKQQLTASFIGHASVMLVTQGFTIYETSWLKEGVAVDFHVDSVSLPSTIYCPPATDCIIQPAPKPQYKLLISDMDSTMITCECIDELADLAGKKEEVAAITERAMNGELVFEDTLAERVALLAGLPERVLQECYNARVKPTPGAKELMAAHKAQGGYSVLVSGGFTFFTSRVRELLGFDEDHSNTLEIKDGKLTGRVIPPILGKDAKLATLHATCKKLGISPNEVLAIGDGANDLPMLLAAGLGIAYHAKPKVQEQVRNRINHGDLSSLIPAITR